MEPNARSLNDLDFVVERFEEIPETLGKDFLFRHVHPGQKRGGTMMQLVDVDAQLRIDVFRAAVAQARNPRLPAEQCQWWYWSRKRKHSSPHNYNVRAKNKE